MPHRPPKKRKYDELELPQRRKGERGYTKVNPKRIAGLERDVKKSRGQRGQR